MGSGHGTYKENKAEHPNRKVHEERFTRGERFGGAGFEGMGDAEYEAMSNDDDLYDEMETRSRLEDEYGGGAGDWDH